MQSDSWIDEYIKLLFPVSNIDLKIEEAVKLKYVNTPNSLFKYRTCNEYSFTNLEEDYIWMSNPVNFNDPYDCGISFKSEPLQVSLLRSKLNYIGDYMGVYLSKEEILFLERSNNFIQDFFSITFSKLDSKLTNDELQIFAQSMNNFFLNEHMATVESYKHMILSSNYVSCFSETNESILMWSHYADYHRGFCIEYDFKSLGISDLRFRMLEPVLYRNEMFDISLYFNAETISNNTANNFVALYASMIKSSEWAYEKEWRIVISNGVFDKEGVLAVPKPKSIYLGVKVPKEDRERLYMIAEKRNIPIYQMKMSENKFLLYSEKS